jgi:uncharacterized protein
MSVRALETLIRDAMRLGINTFSWQGGEPTLMGLDFYKRVVELEMKHGLPGAMVANALQTNGTLIDASWARFFHEYKFLIGLSIDGPKDLHDYYRKDAGGRGTHSRVMKAARVLRDQSVEFNVLVLVNDVNVREPDAVWDFLVEQGFTHLQFIPCVEPFGKGKVAPYSADAGDYGRFIVRTLERYAEAFPAVSVREYDALLMRELGKPLGLCTFDERCGDYVVIEHNGDVFACDFFVTPKWKLGNIIETSLEQIIQSPKIVEFAERKSALGEQCEGCDYMKVCHGGCPKHRDVTGGDTTAPSHFCNAYRMVFAQAAELIPKLVAKIREMG